MTSLRVLGVAVAASVTALLSACAGSDGGSPELLLVSLERGALFARERSPTSLFDRGPSRLRNALPGSGSAY